MAKAQTGKHGGPSHVRIPVKIFLRTKKFPPTSRAIQAESLEKNVRRKRLAPAKKLIAGVKHGHRGETYPDRDRDTYAREAEEDRTGSTPESREAARSIGAAGTTVKTGIAASLRGIDEIETEIVSLVRNTVSNSIRATGAVGTEAVNITRDVVKGALAATEDLGTGLVVTTKSVAKGVALGVSDVGGDVISAASETARAAVNATSAVGGDTLMVAKHTLDGVVEATNETGGNAVETARAVASSAAEAVGGFGTTAVSSVRDILLSVVTGVKDVANAALPGTAARLDDRDRALPPDRTGPVTDRTPPPA